MSPDPDLSPNLNPQLNPNLNPYLNPNLNPNLDPNLSPNFNSEPDWIFNATVSPAPAPDSGPNAQPPAASRRAFSSVSCEHPVCKGAAFKGHLGRMLTRRQLIFGDAHAYAQV
eukprot:5192657-Pleurochrysis_carterae.AAC.2